MNYMHVKKLNLHWFCTQNHILEPFSVRRACTKSYVTSEPYPRASQIWCQNVREIWKKKIIKCRGESFARCRVIARNVEGGLLGPPPPQSFKVKFTLPMQLIKTYRCPTVLCCLLLKEVLGLNCRLYPNKFVCKLNCRIPQQIRM